MQSVSAYIPSYNEQSTLDKTVRSIQAQTVPVSEIFILDDGSTDETAAAGAKLGVSVIRHEKNRGRGAARARAMLEAKHEIVLCVDSGKQIPDNFLEKALTWFDDERVVAAFAHIVQPRPEGVVARWSNRHLLKADEAGTVNKSASLITAAAVVRKSVVLAAGNYNSRLTHSEDAELGNRLLHAGYFVIQDPQLQVVSDQNQNLRQVLERYWRWHRGVDGYINIQTYLKLIAYSLKVMSVKDLKAGDLPAAPISLLLPHYLYWRSLFSRSRIPDQPAPH